VVASVHTRFETYPRYYGLAFLEPLVEAMLRRFYRRCDAIMAPSEALAQMLRDQRMSYDVGVWTRGIDDSLFTPAQPRPRVAREPSGSSGDATGHRLYRPSGDGKGAGCLCRHHR
jgi:phosphatidylinositol alpha 1,6-mannosyltransferase